MIAHPSPIVFLLVLPLRSPAYSAVEFLLSRRLTARRQVARLCAAATAARPAGSERVQILFAQRGTALEVNVASEVRHFVFSGRDVFSFQFSVFGFQFSGFGMASFRADSFLLSAASAASAVQLRQQTPLASRDSRSGKE
jgi:hypothetical protein